jgi:two-component system chemotaxis sensor kinase CheA
MTARSQMELPFTFWVRRMEQTIKNGISEIVGADFIEIREGGEELLEKKVEEIKEIKKSNSVNENKNKDVDIIIVENESIKNESESDMVMNTETKDIKSEDLKEQSTIRVNTEKLDNLVNIVGEMIVAHSSLRIFKEWISEDKIDDFEKIISDLDNITKSMQEDVLSVRMIPIGNTFIQFKRIIIILRIRISACYIPQYQ